MVKYVPRYLNRYSDSLRAWRFGVRTPMEARFSVPVQTGTAAHLAYCTISTGSFPGVKGSWHGVDRPPLSSAEVKVRVELYFYSASVPSWRVIGWTPFIVTSCSHIILGAGNITQKVLFDWAQRCLSSATHFLRNSVAFLALYLVIRGLRDSRNAVHRKHESSAASLSHFSYNCQPSH
jgi:hypothetical protein